MTGIHKAISNYTNIVRNEPHQGLPWTPDSMGMQVGVVYRDINDKICRGLWPDTTNEYGWTTAVKYNDKQARRELQGRLRLRLPWADIKVDEENNSPEVIDGNCIVADVTWKMYPGSPEAHQVKLIFGQPNAVRLLREKLVR